MQCWNNSRDNQQSSQFSAGEWAKDRKSFVPPWGCVRRLCSEPWATEALTGKRHGAACPRSRKLHAISAQPFSCGVLIYQLAAVLQQSCHQWWIKQGKSILSCHVMREQIQYVLKADGWRQGLCLNARHFCREKWAQLDERGSLLSLGLPACCSLSFIVPHGWMWLSAVLQEGKATRM